MQHTPASGGKATLGSSPGPTLDEALKQTRAAIDSNRPWYEALVLRGQEAEARAGEQITAGVAEGLSFAVDAVNVDLLKPVCFGLQTLFEAVKGATAAREELVNLLGYCILISSIVLNQAQFADLPEHIARALERVTAEIKDINNNSRLFHGKTGFGLGGRRLLQHARDREETQQHKDRLQEILDLASTAAVLDSNAVLRRTLDVATSPTHGPDLPDIARVPKSAPPLPVSYVVRGSLLDSVVAALTTVTDGVHPPHVLFGMGGSGKTTLASALVTDDRVRKHYRRGVYWMHVGQNSNLVDLLETLARGMIVDRSGPVEFSGEEEGVRRLTEWVAKDRLPRLVVLDDVLDTGFVNTLRPTGLSLLITTRVRDAVGVGGEYTSIGNMANEEATALLKAQSGAVHLPEEEAKKVAESCGWLALALAIAGALPSIRKNPDDAEAWRDLHTEIMKKKLAEDDLRMPSGSSHDRLKLALFPVLGIGIEYLGEDMGDMFFNLVVLASGVPAPVDMLTNLWEQKDDVGAREKADFLAGRSLLQEAEGDHYQLHDLMVDFVRAKCSSKFMEALVEGAVERQRRYLGRLKVIRRYHDEGERHLHKGMYALVSLWRLLKELSGADMLTETYTASLEMLDPADTADSALDYDAVARLYTLVGKYQQADLLYLRAIEIREKTLGSDELGLAKQLNRRAISLSRQGKDEQAQFLYERAISIWEGTLGSEDAQVALGINNLSATMRAQGDLKQAELLLERSTRISERVLAGDDPLVAAGLTIRAKLLEDQGKFEEAGPLHERSFVILEKVFGSDHPDVADSLNNRAELLHKQGKYQEAEPLCRKVQEIFEKAFGREHPAVAMTLNNRAELLRLQGKCKVAEPLCDLSLAIREKVFGPDHHDVAVSLNNRALLFHMQGKYAEAEPLYRRSMAIDERIYGPQHPRTAAVLQSLASLLGEQGKYEEADLLFGRSLATFERAHGPDTASVANCLSNRASLLRKQGKFEEAGPLYAKAMAIGEKVLGPEHPHFATLLINQAEVLRAQGKNEEAGALYERSFAIREKASMSDHLGEARSRSNRAGLLNEKGTFSDTEALPKSVQPGHGRGDQSNLVIVVNSRAKSLRAQGKYKEAGLQYERLVGILENTLGPDHPDVANCLSIRAGLLKKEGKYHDAGPLYERAVTIGEKALGPAHPDLAVWINNQAKFLENQGEYSEAFLLFERAQSIFRNRLGENHDYTASTRKSVDRMRKQMDGERHYADLAILLNSRAEVLRAQGKYEKAEPLYVKVLRILGVIVGDDHPHYALVLKNRAELLKAQGKVAEAKLLYKASMGIFERSLSPNHPVVATMLDKMACLSIEQGNLDEAEQLNFRAIAIGEQTWGSDHPSFAKALNNQAELLEEQGKYDEADPLYFRAIEIGEEKLRPTRNHPELATWLNNRARLLHKQGKYRDAEALVKRALPINMMEYGPEHPEIAVDIFNLAGLVESMGKCTEAEPLYKRATAIWETNLGPAHPTVAVSLNNWAGLMGSQGKYAEAEHLYERSREIREKALGLEHPKLALALNNQAALMQTQGKFEEADRLYERSLAIVEKALGPDHPRVAESLNNRASLLQMQGKHHDAGVLYKRAVAIGEKALGSEHPDLAMWINNRAKWLESQEEYSEAFPLFERAHSIFRKRLGENHDYTVESLAVVLRSEAGLGPLISSSQAASLRNNGDPGTIQVLRRSRQQ